jgi:hypothetical protein
MARLDSLGIEPGIRLLVRDCCSVRVGRITDSAGRIYASHDVIVSGAVLDVPIDIVRRCDFRCIHLLEG